jgi:hypothetical protein
VAWTQLFKGMIAIHESAIHRRREQIACATQVRDISKQDTVYLHQSSKPSMGLKVMRIPSVFLRVEYQKVVLGTYGARCLNGINDYREIVKYYLVE